VARTSSQLRVSFVVDTGGLRSGFGRATKETDRFGKASQKTARSTLNLGSALRTAAFAAGGAAAAYVSIAQARQAVTTTQELALATMGLNRNLGLATKEASRWAAVTRARGVDSKTLTMSFTSLSRAIEGTKTGTESALRPFRDLGITQKELAATGGNFSKQVLIIADALGNAEGSSTRQAAAAKLLGRGYRDLLPLFAEGSKGLQEQLKWADEFGATMGQGTVDAMSEFTTAQRRGRVAIMGLQIAFAKFATPAITEAIEGLGQFAAVLNDPSLTKAQKLSRLKEEFDRLQDRVISIINDLVPIVAQSAGEIGIALARGIAKGFQEAPIVGKVVLAGMVVSMFGGPRAIIAAGSTVGALMSRGIASTVAARTAATEAFAMSRTMPAGLNRGVAASTVAAAGAAAPVMARSIFSSLARAIPVVAATFAIGDVLLSAIAGDMRGAAVKGGGTAIGATLGAIIGSVIPGAGTLAGAGIGAGLGAIGGNIINGIIGGVDKEAPKLGERISTIVDRLGRAADQERGAYARLSSASRFLVDSRRAQKAATDRVREAEAKLARARRAFGPNSEEAIQAERRLARAKNAVARATQRARNAERVYGVERKATKVILRDSVKDQKAELFALRNKRTRLDAIIKSTRFANLSDERRQSISRAYIQVSRAIDKGQRNLNQSYLEAGQKVGPKFANSLERISGRTESLRRDVAKLKSGVSVNTRTMSKAYREQLERMITATRGAITVLNNEGSIQVAPTGPGGASGPVPRRRKGGSISGGGKMVTAAVSPGELISYRGREIYVPGRPEPRDSVLMNLPVGAKVFTRDGQMRRAMGATDAQALRDQAPHFAEGGIVRPQMIGGIPGPRRVANTGFGQVHKAAIRAYRRNMVTDLAGAERLAAKFGLQVSSAYRPGDDGYHGINRARDFVGSASEMYRFAQFIGSRFGNRLLELIYSPLGWSIKNGLKTAPYAVDDHYDHVHVAMRKGGRITANSPLRQKKRWGPNALHTLAAAVGMPNPGLMAQIAQGESGGRADLNNAGLNPDGSVDYGLWQINSIHGKPVSGMLNPIQNALYAREILSSQGLSAWVAYTNGRYAQFSPGRFDREIYYDLLYSARAQRGAKRSAKRKVGRVGDMRKAAKERGATPAARKRIGLAAAAAKKALRLARIGDVGGSRRAGRAATRFLSKARSGLGDKQGGSTEGSSAAGFSSFLALPESVRNSLPFEDRVALLERDLAVAAGTSTTKDDLAVIGAQIRLFSGLRNRSIKTIARTNRQLRGFTDKKLAKARRDAKSKNEERRKAGKRYLARYRRLTGQRSDAIGDLSRAESEITSAKEARGEVFGGTDLAEAMKELADAINEQNEIAKGVQATSSREALRMLSDVISGQIVGKRIAPSTTPQGVRY